MHQKIDVQIERLAVSSTADYSFETVADRMIAFVVDGKRFMQCASALIGGVLVHHLGLARCPRDDDERKWSLDGLEMYSRTVLCI